VLLRTALNVAIYNAARTRITSHGFSRIKHGGIFHFTDH
jgi:hypothetical protein